MNRSKVVIGIFVALILIVIAIVLLACTVFVVREVEVESDVSSELIDADRIIESSGLNKGRSIISIKKEVVKTTIEKDNPYVEVLSIKRVFPSKVLVNVTVRKGIMLVASFDNSSYALIDSSMKVLNIVSTVEGNRSNATVIKGLTFDMPDGGALEAVGAKINLSDPICGEYLSDIASLAADYDLQGRRFFTFFKEISFDKTEGIVIYVKTNKGVSLVLDNSLSSTIYSQLFYCLTYYSSKDVNIDFTKGYICFDKNTNAYVWKETIN